MSTRNISYAERIADPDLLDLNVPIAQVETIGATNLILEEIILNSAETDYESNRTQGPVIDSIVLDSEDPFYERNRNEEAIGMRVYGSDSPDLDVDLVSAQTIVPPIDVEDDEAYYAKFPAASSCMMTLTYFDSFWSQNSAEALGKCQVKITHERQARSALNDDSKNSVDFVTATKSHAQLYQYPRKTSLFFTEPEKEWNPEDYQLIVHPSNG